MPKIWSDTIEAHRQAVHDATLDAVAELVAKHGVASVTMSQIASETGIGRATLYKYFPDLQAILTAWHERHVNKHLQQLARVHAASGDIVKRLESMLETYAMISYEQRRGNELAVLLHRGSHVAQAHRKLSSFIRDLIAECAKLGLLRNDVAPEELARYCLHALAAASAMTSKAAVRRLLRVTIHGLQGS